MKTIVFLLITLPASVWSFNFDHDLEKTNYAFIGQTGVKPLSVAPPNDDCSGAVVLPLNFDLNCAFDTSGTTVDATGTMPPITGCVGVADDDVWFRFQAASPRHRLKLTGFTEDLAIQLFSGSCGNLTAVDCRLSSGNVLETQFNNLTAGDVYYLRVYTVGSGVATGFDICLGTPPPPPPNDSCSTADTLVVNNDLICATVLDGGTFGGLPADTLTPACIGSDDDEIWFRFEAKKSQHNVSLTSGYHPFVFQVFSGTCADKQSIYCSPEIPVNTVNTFHATGLDSGETYFVRVYTHGLFLNSTFSLCVTTPPDPLANTVCSGALNVPVNPGLTCIDSLNGQTSTGAPAMPPLSSCGGEDDDDVWFQFTASSASHRFQLANASEGMYFQGFAGDCNGLSLLSCSNLIPAGGSTVVQWDNLTIGETYYVRVYTSAEYTYGTFTLCVLTPAPAPPNNNCGGAVQLDVSPDLDCTVPYSEDTYLGFAPVPPIAGCVGDDEDDVWFRFIAMDSTHRIRVTDGTEWLVLQTFSGACGNLTSIDCFDAFNGNFERLLTGLTVGETYYVRLYTRLTGVQSPFSICVVTPPPPPANDGCANAIVLPNNVGLPCITSINGSTTGGLPTQPALPACGGEPDDDIWYKFTAVSPRHRLYLNNPLQNFFVQVFSGDCQNPDSVYCSSVLPPGGPKELALDDLTVGETYLVRVYTDINLVYGDFTLCLVSLPANDDCAFAPLLFVNPLLNCDSTLEATTFECTPSVPPVSGCTGVADDDVWFRFTATGTSNRISLIGGTEDLVLQVFTGNCNNLVSIACADPGSGEFEYPLYGLTPGATYFIRVYTKGDSVNSHFWICVTTPPSPPANDNCAGATDLTVNPDLDCATTLYTSTFGGLPTFPGIATCTGEPDDDVWFQFTAGSTSHRIKFELATEPLVFQVFSETCGSLVSLICSETVNGAAEEQVDGLTIGETYFIRVFTSDELTFGDFRICIGTPPPPPANDLCSAAVALTVNTNLNCNNTVNSTTAGATPTNPAIPGCTGTADDDVWFSFVATAASQRVNITGTTDSMVVQLFSGNCNGLVSMGCTQGSGAGVEEQFNGLNPGTTYYLRVFTAAKLVYSDFTICIGTPPPPPANDLCAAAVQLQVNTNLVCTNTHSSTTAGATPSIPNPGACGGSADDDVWFRFTATAASHRVKVTGGGVAWAVEGFSGNCAALVPIACKVSDTDSAQVQLNGLIPGTEYFVRVYSKNNLVYGSFTICVGTPPPAPANDQCSAAVLLTVNNNLNCANTLNSTTVGATPSGSWPGCAKVADDDVWFRFVATDSIHRVKIYGGSYPLSVQAFSGACGALVPLQCVDSDSGEVQMQLTGLTIGSTFYIRAFTGVELVYSDFTICIGTPPPPPANDNCAAATLLTVNPDLSCMFKMTVNTTGANVSNPDLPVCQGTADDDLWFRFTATSISHRLRLTGGSKDQVVQLYSGSCGNLNERHCEAGVNGEFEHQYNGLTPGDAYYLRVFTAGNFVADTFIICMGTPPAAPAYDDCANAEWLFVNDSLVCDSILVGSTFGAFPSNPAPVNCGGTPDDDVWFKFKATKDIHRVSVSGAFNTTTFQVFSGACTSLNQVYCHTEIPVNGAGTAQLTGLQLDSTYYIRVYTWGNLVNTTFNLCVLTVPDAPANDTCAGALVLNVSPDLSYADSVGGQTTGALPTMQALPDCGVTATNDVWYRFTAVEAYHRIKIWDGSRDLVFQLFSGNCANPQAVICSPMVPAGSARELQWPTLTPGADYLIRVYAYNPFENTTFKIAVGTPDEPPVNDVCSGATLLPVNPILECDTSIYQAPYAGLPPYPPLSVCAGDDDDDLWFRFVATSPSHRYRVIADSLWMVAQTFSGSCGNLTEIDCFDAFTSTFARQLYGLTVGQTYYVRLFTRENNAFTGVDMCMATPPPAPPNDSCQGAIPLNINPDLTCNSALQSTTEGGTPSAPGLPFCGGQADDDVWYKFTAENANHRLSLFGNDKVLRYQVFSGACNALVSLKCAEAMSIGDSSVAQLNGLTVGEDYYVRVYGHNFFEFANFNICVATSPAPPANDNCGQAVALTVNDSLVCTDSLPGSTYGGLQSGVNIKGCVCTPDDDVWYRFTAVEKRHRVRVSSSVEDGVYFEVLKGDCDSLISIGCSFGSEWIDVEHLVPGDTYFVRVYTHSPNAFGAFGICVGTPPPPPVNDDCPDAMTLQINVNENCTINLDGDNNDAGNSQAPDLPCSGTADQDVWFRFTADGSEHDLTLTGGAHPLRVQLFSGNCNQLVSMECSELVEADSAITLHLDSLTPGSTYRLRVFPSDTALALGSNRGVVDKFNLCGFHWVPLNALEPFASIRIYIPSGWMWRPGGLFVEPLFQGQTPTVFGYDTYFADAKAQNLVPIATVNQTPDWYAGLSNGQGSNDFPPIKPGLSRTDPASYKDWAGFLWQLTARYGRVSYPDSMLRVDTTRRWPTDIQNVKKSGLDLLRYIEVWNEPDKWWKLGGPENDAFINAEEYAALLSASYDSIKAADPSMMVVMAGLTSFDTAYLNAMLQWCIANRPNQDFPADIINVHHYSNIAAISDPPVLFADGAISPEADLSFEDIQYIIAFGDNLGKETWMTEFGSDTRGPSFMYSKPFKGFTPYDLQAQWLLRGYLEYVRYGTDNMYMFNAINEPNASNAGLYQNCGLLYGGDDTEPFTPKQSYRSLTKLIEDLKETAYEEDLSISNPSVRIMSFRKKSGGQLLVYWSPTMTDTLVQFTVSGLPTLTATEWPQLYEVRREVDFNICVKTPEESPAIVDAKVFLNGPYVSSTQLMRDELRTKGLIPLQEPYTGLSGFAHTGGGGGETTTPAVLSVSGNDAIVDWVFLELRSAADPKLVVATRSALLQRDGDVVDTDGVSPVHFQQAGGASYYLAVRHRNHLGVQLGATKMYPVGTTVTTDFRTTPPEGYFQNNGLNTATRPVSGRNTLWSGNGRVDKQVKYNGSANDRTVILARVGIAEPNDIEQGYLIEDYNLDGLVKYNGSANDRNVVLGNVGLQTPSTIIHEQTGY